MRIEIDNSGIEEELRILPRRRRSFKKATDDDIEDVSILTMWKVKRAMPVDTGRAQSYWGVFTPELLGRLSRYQVATILAVPVWEVEDDGLSITQGILIDPYNYVENLNAGSSRQAPAMFLDVIAEQAGDLLVSRVVRNADHL